MNDVESPAAASSASVAPRRLLILTEGYSNPLAAKTATSVVRYRGSEVVALLDSTEAGKSCQQLLGVGRNLPVVSRIDEAPTANTLMIGIAPPGGRIPAAWRPILLDAIGRGMDIISGLHDFLADDPQLVAAAEASGATLYDVRKNSERSIARRQGIRDQCLRIHTVGNDCSVGKMVVAIEVARGLKRRGHDAKFVATGQTGIMIEGDGCPVDCVVADFVSGAVEKQILAHQHHEFLLVEGQGSLAHPCYSAVTLGLLHGCLPQAMILCYEVGRTRVNGMEQIPLHSLSELRGVYERMANLMHPSRVIGVAMNSRRVTAAEAEKERRHVAHEMGLPVCDVVRDGPDRLVEAVLAMKPHVVEPTHSPTP